MTTETSQTNKTIIIGYLDTMLVRGKGKDKETGRPKREEVTRKTGRNTMKGKWESLSMQVGSPYGGMFGLALEIDPKVPGAELLDEAQPDTMLAIEGSLQP